MLANTTGNLLGANNAMDVIRTPMKVYKEARARGDEATMKRAMGYVEKFSEDARTYKSKADEALKEEAAEAKEKEKLEREELAERIKENRTESEKQLEEASESPVVSGAENTSGTENPDAPNASENAVKIELSTERNEPKTDTVNVPITYTRSGATVSLNPEIKLSVTV